MRSIILAAAVWLLAACVTTADDDIWSDCQAGRGEQALDACAAVIASGLYAADITASAHNLRGVAYGTSRQPEMALREYEAAVAISPDYAVAINNRGRAHRALGHYGLAIADFDRAISLEPSNDAFLNEACWIRTLAERDLERAAELCDAAVALSPNNADILDSRAVLRLKTHDFSGALADYDAALDHASANLDHFRYGRGIALIRMGRVDEGQSEIDAALALNPSIDEVFAGFGLRP
ncbi:MAG: tetratricopeptide repeat protein [Hyphomonadaceae bacterium]